MWYLIDFFLWILFSLKTYFLSITQIYCRDTNCPQEAALDQRLWYLITYRLFFVLFFSPPSFQLLFLLEQRGTQEPEDLLRIHCWVLVLAGYRGVKQNFFIDPLTGMSYRTNSPSFLGIESVWNNYNCYINMQDCGQGCSVSPLTSNLHYRVWVTVNTMLAAILRLLVPGVTVRISVRVKIEPKKSNSAFTVYVFVCVGHGVWLGGHKSVGAGCPWSDQQSTADVQHGEGRW